MNKLCFIFLISIYSIRITTGQDNVPSKLNPLKIFSDSIERQNRYFVYTESNTIIYADVIRYEDPFFGSSYLLVDLNKIYPEYVKFYKSGDGFFANVRSLDASGYTDFATRVSKGKINLYKKTITHTNTGSYNASTGFYSGGGVRTKHYKNYYNIGFGEMKIANYQSLYVDLAGNSAAMMHLNKFKSLTDIQTALYVGGGILIIGGFASMINNFSNVGSQNRTSNVSPNPEPNIVGPIILLGLGSGCFWASYFISLTKPEHLRNAVDVFNQ